MDIDLLEKASALLAAIDGIRESPELEYLLNDLPEDSNYHQCYSDLKALVASRWEEVDAEARKWVGDDNSPKT